MNPSFKKSFQKIRAAVRRIFFWHARTEGSHEFSPETRHDHALVLSVTESKRVPRWQQIRFLNRVLNRNERRLLWGALAIGVLSIGLAATDLVRPHIGTVPSVGGTFTEGVVGTPKLINPLFASLNDVDRDLSALIYSGLFRFDQDLQPQPDLAESYRWLEDGKTLEIRLRKDARWHDGEPVTADDVVFTYQAVRNPNWHSPLAGVYRGTKAIRIDDATVQIQLDKSNPSLFADLTLGILPAHVWEDVPDINAQLAEANIKPVGSGPYRAENFTRDAKGSISSYQLQRFSNYYGLKPSIDRFVFRFYGDRDQAQGAIKTNQIDALAFVPWNETKQLKSPTLKELSLDLPQETVVFFNVKDDTLKEEKMRQALATSIDRKELQDLIGPHATLASSPFPFLDVTTTAPNLDNARKQLDALGWKQVEGQPIRQFVPKSAAPTTAHSTPLNFATSTATIAASSTQLTITIDVPDQADLLNLADLLKRRWSLLGIKVDVVPHDAESLLRSAVTDRDYQVLIWNILLPPNQDLTPFWSSANATTYGLNLSNLADRDIDRALDAVKAATSTQDLLSTRTQLSQAIMARTPALFLLRPRYAYLVSKRIQNATDERITRPSDRLLGTVNWYITTGWRWK